MSDFWNNTNRSDFQYKYPEEDNNIILQVSELNNKPVKSDTQNTDLQNEMAKEMVDIKTKVCNALDVIDDVMMKNYLTKMRNLPISSTIEGDDTQAIYMYKVNKIVYEKDEYATDKFASVISALTFAHLSVFLILDGYDDTTDFYLGIKGNDEVHSSRYLAETLANALQGQFPGIKLDDMSLLYEGTSRRKEDNLLDRLVQSSTISSCTSIPSLKDKNGKYTNATFIQGIEKFVLAMRGKRYTSIILAENIDNQEIQNIRNGYEVIYEQLSLKSTHQLSYSTNESLANALSRTKGLSNSSTISHTEGKSSSDTTGSSTNQDNVAGRIGKMSGPLTMAGALLAATGGGAPLGLALMGTSVVGQLFGAIKSKQNGTSNNRTEGVNSSDSINKTVGESFSETDGTTSTIGSTKSFTITSHNKHIQELLKRIDKQLERIAEFESTGLWSTGAYFMSYDNDRATAETAATIYKSIVQGENSGVELSAINTWYENDSNFNEIRNHVSCMEHPSFYYSNDTLGTLTTVTPTSMLSSKEISLMIGLPRKSVPGLLVRQQATFGNKVVTENECNDTFRLGYISNLDNVSPNNTVDLSINSLSSHTFVTGSTGCGKSNTVYLLIDSLLKAGKKFMVIEPAKGEYKNIFGHLDNVEVYGTNSNLMNPLKINPFAFPDGIHVEEHIDRLIDIFSACWPMYAAMPAVLKKSITNAYKSCGWDLVKSESIFDIYPTFKDVIRELNTYINSSEYSSDSKGDYKGALGTRLESLTNGIVGQIFVEDLLPLQSASNDLLFNNNVIIDLSRVGSMETKALIMGILIMRLNEFRMSEGLGMNLPLRHITVLEEAHNLLKATSTSQSQEGSNVLGKSVEMISSSIAEVRTYGEGFIIADQSPSMLDKSAISNTNTKIVMALPNKEDRDIAGNSTSLTEEQKLEISKLKTGVAVVFQKGWEEAVLCKIDRFSGEEILYKKKEVQNIPDIDENTVIDADFVCSLPDEEDKISLVKLLIDGYNEEDDSITLEQINSAISSDHSLDGMQQYNMLKKLYEIQDDDNDEIVIPDICAILFVLYIGVDEFPEISSTSTDIHDFNQKVSELISRNGNIDEDNEDIALEIYVKGCCLMNVTDFFDEWINQTYN